MTDVNTEAATKQRKPWSQKSREQQSIRLKAYHEGKRKALEQAREEQPTRYKTLFKFGSIRIVKEVQHG